MFLIQPVSPSCFCGKKKNQKCKTRHPRHCFLDGCKIGTTHQYWQWCAGNGHPVICYVPSGVVQGAFTGGGGGVWDPGIFIGGVHKLRSPLEFNFTACLQIIIATCHQQSYLTCKPSMPVLSGCKFYKCLQSDECIQGFWVLLLEPSLWQYNLLSYSKILSIGPARNQVWAYHSKRQAPELTELTNFSHHLSGMWHSYLVLALALKARICSAYRCSLIW